MHKTTEYKSYSCNRREFLRWSAAVAAGLPWAVTRAAELAPFKIANAKVAIVPCREYGPAVRAALAQAFDSLGGIGRLVKQKTVTIKINLTGFDFKPVLGPAAGRDVHDAPRHDVGAGELAVRGGRARGAVRRIHPTPPDDGGDTAGGGT